MASKRGSDAPSFWIIAGPNGSGKSSLYGSGVDHIYGNTKIAGLTPSFWIINPDLLAQRIRSTERLSLRRANIEAVERIEAWLDASIAAHQSVGVETVLSTDKYRRLVADAKSKGYQVRLVYVILETPSLNVDRVRLRVKKGGHRVPIDKIRERWKRSLEQLPWFLEQADWALLFDNSAHLKLIGQKNQGVLKIDPDAPAAIQDAIATMQTSDNRLA